MNSLGKEQLEAALKLLGELIAARGHPHQHFVVCGGSSLLVMGLVTRATTKDVDVLARFENERLEQAKPLPDWLQGAADDVQEQLGLPKNWFNTGPADDSFFRLGFPEGLESRLTPRRYGEFLTISFISRYDQVFFKLYATADQGPGRHFLDLKELSPTQDELIAAARWTRTQDPSEGFKLVLSELLGELGHEDVSSQI